MRGSPRLTASDDNHTCSSSALTFATKGKLDRGAYFPQASVVEASHPSADPVLRNCREVVEVDRTGAFHTVVEIQENFRDCTPDGRGDRRYRHTVELPKSVSTSE